MFAQSVGKVKTNTLELGLTGGSDVDGNVSVSRPSGSVMQFKSGAGTFTLSELATASQTTRTGITKKTAVQGPTIVIAGASNVRWANGVGQFFPVSGAYPAQIENLLQLNPLTWESNVVNEGRSGFSSVQAWNNLDDIMEHPGARGGNDPDMIVLVYGGNDIAVGSTDDPAAFIEAMTSITQAVITSGTVPVIVSIADIEFGSFVSNPEITNDTEMEAALDAWNTALKALAERSEVAYFDQNELIGQANASSQYYVEESGGGRIHFSWQGIRRVAVELTNFIHTWALINSNNLATRVDTLRFDDPNIDLQNQDSLTASSNETLTLTTATTVYFQTDYRAMTNDTAGDLKILEYIFYGSGVGIVGVQGPDAGKLDVTIDSGTPEEVDMFREATNTIKDGQVLSAVLWSRRDLDFSTHTLEVELKNTHTGSASNVLWLQGLVVERGSMNRRLESDFSTTITGTSLILADNTLDNRTAVKIVDVIGLPAASPRQRVVFSDTDFNIEKTGSNDLFQVDMANGKIGFRVDDIETDFHVEVADALLIRNVGAGPLAFPLGVTRDSYDVGDVDGLGFAETVGGDITGDFYSAVGSEVVDNTDGTIDGRLLFSVGVNNSLTPVVKFDDDISTFSMPVWIAISDTGLPLPTQAKLFIENDGQTNVVTVSSNDNSAGYFLGDEDNAFMSGVFYSNVLERLSISANATNIILLDDSVTTISYGSSGVLPTATTRLFIEDDGDVDLTLGTTSSDTPTINFADEADNDPGRIEYGHTLNNMKFYANDTLLLTLLSTGITLANANVEIEEGLHVNSSEGDNDFRVDGNGESNLLYADAANFRVGIGTNLPGQNLMGGATDYGASTVIHVKDPVNPVSFTAEGEAAVYDAMDLGGGADDKGMRWITDGGISKFHSLNDNTTARVDNVLVMDMGSGNVGIGTVSPGATIDIIKANISGDITPIVNSAGTLNGEGVAAESLMLFNKMTGTIRPANSGTVDRDVATLYLEQPVRAGGGSISGDSAILWIADGNDSGFAGINYAIYCVDDNDSYIAGNVGIGTASPTYRLDVEDTGAYTAEIVNTTDDGQNNIPLRIESGESTPGTPDAVLIDFRYNGNNDAGNISFDGADLDFVSPSDRKLKKEVKASERLDKERARNIIQQVEIVDFLWKNDSSSSTKRLGMIANDVETYYPEAVSDSIRLKSDGTTETIKMLSKAKFIPVLLQETQRQQKELDNMKTTQLAMIAAIILLFGIVIKLARREQIGQADIDKMLESKGKLEEIKAQDDIM